jgi:hypothetical protein
VQALAGPVLGALGGVRLTQGHGLAALIVHGTGQHHAAPGFGMHQLDLDGHRFAAGQRLFLE